MTANKYDVWITSDLYAIFVSVGNNRNNPITNDPNDPNSPPNGSQ